MPVETQARWLKESVGVRVLDERLVIAVGGDDARTWLNGQLTNDVKVLSAAQNVFGLLLSTKGRILGDATVHEHEGSALLEVPRAAWPALSAHLEKYIIMEDVTLHEMPDLVVVTAQGPRAGALMPDAAASDRLRSGGRDRLVSRDTLDATLRSLGASASSLGGGLVTEEAWELARIRAGVPRFGADFDEHVYPHEAGLDKTAVSFQKGCYLGQEVVCMLESRGQISRRLTRLESDEPLALGAALLDAGGAEVGRISSIALDGEKTLALGMIKRVVLAAGGSVRAGDTAVVLAGPA